MNSLDFFTQVKFDRNEKSMKYTIFESIEGYFSFFNLKKTYVIPGRIFNGSQEVELRDSENLTKQNIIFSAIKIATYLTVIIPFIMLASKCIFRMTHKFHVYSQEASISAKKIQDFWRLFVRQMNYNTSYIINHGENELFVASSEKLFSYMRGILKESTMSKEITDSWLSEEEKEAEKRSMGRVPGGIQSFLFTVLQRVDPKATLKRIQRFYQENAVEGKELVESQLEDLLEIKKKSVFCLQAIPKKHLNNAKIKALTNSYQQIIKKIDEVFFYLEFVDQLLPEAYLEDLPDVMSLSSSDFIEFDAIFSEAFSKIASSEIKNLLQSFAEEKITRVYCMKKSFKRGANELIPRDVTQKLKEIRVLQKEMVEDFPFLSAWRCVNDPIIVSKIYPLIKTLALEDLFDIEVANVAYGCFQKDIWDEGIREAYPPSLQELILISLKDLYSPFSRILLERMRNKERVSQWSPIGNSKVAQEERERMIGYCEEVLKRILPGQRNLLDGAFEFAKKYNDLMGRHRGVLKSLSENYIFDSYGTDKYSVIGRVGQGFQINERGNVCLVSQKEEWEFEQKNSEVICNRGNPLENFRIHAAPLLSPVAQRFEENSCIPLINCFNGDMSLLHVKKNDFSKLEEMHLFPVFSVKNFVSSGRKGVDREFCLKLVSFPPRTRLQKSKGGHGAAIVYRTREKVPGLKNISALTKDHFLKKKMERYNEEKQIFLKRFVQANSPNLSKRRERQIWRQRTISLLQMHINELVCHRENLHYCLYGTRKDLFDEMGRIRCERFMKIKTTDLTLEPIMMQRFLEDMHRICFYEQILNVLRFSESLEDCEKAVEKLGAVEPVIELDFSIPFHRAALVFHALTGKTLTLEQLKYLEKSQENLEMGNSMFMLAGTGFGKTEMMILFVLILLHQNYEKRVCCSTIVSNMATLKERFAPFLGMMKGGGFNVLWLEQLQFEDLNDCIRLQRIYDGLNEASFLCMSDRERLIVSYLANFSSRLSHHAKALWIKIYREIQEMHQVFDEMDLQCLPMDEDENFLLEESIFRLTGERVPQGWVSHYRLMEVFRLSKSLIACSATCSLSLNRAITKTGGREEIEKITQKNLTTSEVRLYDWMQNQTTWVHGEAFTIENAIRNCRRVAGDFAFDLIFVDNNNEVIGIDKGGTLKSYNEKKILAAEQMRRNLGEEKQVWLSLKKENGDKAWHRVLPSGLSELVSPFDYEKAIQEEGEGISYLCSYDDVAGTNFPQSGGGENFSGHFLSANLLNPESEEEWHCLSMALQFAGRARKAKEGQQFVFFKDEKPGQDDAIVKRVIRKLRRAEGLREEFLKSQIIEAQLEAMLINLVEDTKNQIQLIPQKESQAEILKNQFIEQLSGEIALLADENILVGVMKVSGSKGAAINSYMRKKGNLPAGLLINMEQFNGNVTFRRALRGKFCKMNALLKEAPKDIDELISWFREGSEFSLTPRAEEELEKISFLQERALEEHCEMFVNFWKQATIKRKREMNSLLENCRELDGISRDKVFKSAASKLKNTNPEKALQSLIGKTISKLALKSQ